MKRALSSAVKTVKQAEQPTKIVVNAAIDTGMKAEQPAKNAVNTATKAIISSTDAVVNSDAVKKVAELGRVAIDGPTTLLGSISDLIFLDNPKMCECKEQLEHDCREFERCFNVAR